MATNLDFVARWDLDRFKKKCEDQRKLAEKWPAYDKRMAFVEDYRWQMGPWALAFMLETWGKEPVWHGSAAVVELVGHTTVDHKLRMEVPQEALLATTSWDPEHFRQARYILAEVFGPILRPGDKHQPALETKALWALHHHVKHEGERTWLKLQH